MRDDIGVPKIVDRSTFQSELDALRVREKAHTHEGDAIAAARRRLPMVEMDPAVRLIGAQGAVTLLDAFEGGRQLIAYSSCGPPASLHRSSAKAAPGLHRKCANSPIFILVTLPSRCFAKVRMKRVRGIETSWDGKYLGTRPRTQSASSWLRRSERAG